MIKGIGVDVVEISRISNANKVERFVQHVYTKREQEYCNSRNKQSSASYAARFAAKEAFVKALGTGMVGGTWSDIEVLTDNHGAPYIELHGNWKNIVQEKGVKGIFVSLSHSREYAVAQVVLEG